MNNTIKCIVAFLMLGAPVYSQTSSPSAPSPAQTDGSQSMMQSPDQVIGRMTSRLNLSDDQKSKITLIIADRQSQVKAVMGDSTSRRMQKARKLKSVMSDSDSKIMAILTPDQQKTYQQMISERQQQIRAQMQQMQ